MFTNNVLAFLGGLGGWEVLLILVVVLVLFGAKRIPELARGLGQGIREFKNATNDIKNEIEGSVREEPAPKRPVYKEESTSERPTVK
ncbi:sec-independent protein translocase protein TatA [Catalinimonas alkaloidigena]|uniref:Sec-independent protein translocase protein TatA n=1 Tax=Catalinimonas alkaloidigena TaxID=1075417 RepID=A0A1G9DVP1_9BACT|nr:twin-arginine translocase TatA/TatE family subunit [Catalinimonas alkaloidigena]SDK67914.1 sec-independent protein translocase protein TatA [Catalinimonas alkaloidigena]